MVGEIKKLIMEVLIIPAVAAIVLALLFIKEAKATKKIIREHPEIKQEPIV